METRAQSNPSDLAASRYHIDWPSLCRIGFVALCGILSFTGLGPTVRQIDLVALMGVMVGAYPIVAEALAADRKSVV